MAGCMVHLRTSLLRHPSFWAQEEPVHLIDQVLEDSGVIASEKQVYAALSSQTTMMVANLDEHTCNVGFHSSQNDCFRRLLASGAGETSGELLDSEKFEIIQHKGTLDMPSHSHSGVLSY